MHQATLNYLLRMLAVTSRKPCPWSYPQS